jgi:hypothetical protein
MVLPMLGFGGVEPHPNPLPDFYLIATGDGNTKKNGFSAP